MIINEFEIIQHGEDRISQDDGEDDPWWDVEDVVLEEEGQYKVVLDSPFRELVNGLASLPLLDAINGEIRFLALWGTLMKTTLEEDGGNKAKRQRNHYNHPPAIESVWYTKFCQNSRGWDEAKLDKEFRDRFALVCLDEKS
jgi:hypothetical protein